MPYNTTSGELQARTAREGLIQQGHQRKRAA